MVDPIFFILGMVAGKFFSALTSKLAGKVSDELLSKLKGDPARNAFKQALGKAIHSYATTDKRLILARPLLEKNGPLTEDSVVEEITQIVRFRREPNAKLIGDRWRAAIDNPPRWCDFTKEAELLVEHLKDKLHDTEVFYPVFDSKSIESIDTTVGISAKILANIENQLAELVKLMSTMEPFFRAPLNIYDQIRDYTWFIDEKTWGFVGRQWVFDEVNRFMNENPRGYFFVIGDPGIGKSALATQMVKQNGYVHHFNIRANGITRASQFLKNVCAQLIANYQLEHTILPPEAAKDSGFLNELLVEVSNKLKSGKKCVLVVDALDEADIIGISPSENLLYLPLIVPKGVYIIVTMRDKREIMPHIQCEQGKLHIKADSSANLTDVADFLQASTARLGIQAYIEAQNIEAEDFVTMMANKSEGNFMYLRHVLPEIESRAYKDLKLDAIPVGLKNYYEDHWRRMRGKDEETWFKYKLPIIMALTVVKKPVSIDLIAEFSGVKERPRIRAVLHEWAQFLHEERVEYEDGLQKRYRLYHDSFHDFIARKEEVADERVDLRAAQTKIADILWPVWSELYGDG